MKTLKMVMTVILLWMTVGVAGAEVPMIKISMANELIQLDLPKVIVGKKLLMEDLEGNLVEWTLSKNTGFKTIFFYKREDGTLKYNSGLPYGTPSKDDVLKETNWYIVFSVPPDVKEGRVCFQEYDENTPMCLLNNTSSYQIETGFGIKKNFQGEGFVPNKNELTLSIRDGRQVILHYPEAKEYPARIDTYPTDVNIIRTVGYVSAVDIQNVFLYSLQKDGNWNVVAEGYFNSLNQEVEFPLPPNGTQWGIGVNTLSGSVILIDTDLPEFKTMKGIARVKMEQKNSPNLETLFVITE